MIVSMSSMSTSDFGNVVSVDAREARAGVDRRSCVRRVELVSHQVGKPAEPGGARYEARHEQPPHTDHRARRSASASTTLSCRSTFTRLGSVAFAPATRRQCDQATPSRRESSADARSRDVLGSEPMPIE